jgi:hypothetical protein
MNEDDRDAAATELLHEQQGRKYVRLLNLLACGQIALFLSTALWAPPFRYPQVPLFSILREWPVWLDVAAFVGSLAGTFFARRPGSRPTRRIRHAVCAISFALLFSFNQHRLQPWAYQFFILHAWLALANPGWMLTGWRWLTISIYIFSALSKLDYSFCTQHGPFLWDGFLHACGFADGTAHWPANVRFLAAAVMPTAELLAAGCLCFQRTQRWGLLLSLLMHLFLIVALGPWGHDHSAGVLLWNGFFIVQNWLLFSNPVQVLAPRESRGALGGPRGNSPDDSPGAKTFGVIAWLLLAIPLLAPLGEPLGYWDHWPSWAVYAARPEKTTVFVHEDDLELIPIELRTYLQPPAPLEPWHQFRLDRWSLDAAKVPISPQDRFQVGVALALAERCQLTTLRLTIDGPPNRWTGRRTQREFVGVAAVRDLAATYRLNALPR